MDSYSFPSRVRRSSLELPNNNSDLLVRGLPSTISESNALDIFSRFGEIRSFKMFPGSVGDGSVNDAIVGLCTEQQSMAAIHALNGAPTSVGVLEVTRHSSQLHGSQSPPLETIQEPCDNVYVRQLPGNWTEKELQDLFTPYGTVQECRVLHRGDDSRGAGALVRMHSVVEATNAILALNGQVPRSANGECIHQPLLVRFADSPEEKARKQARKELQAGRQHRSLDLPKKWSHPAELQHTADLRTASLPLNLNHRMINGNLDLGMSPAPCSNDFLQNAPQSDYPINHLEALLSVIYPNGTADSKMMLPNNGDMMAMNGFYDSGLGSPAGLPKSMPPANNPLPPVQSTTYTSVYVKNLPADANDLWVYERFAPHGSILSVKVLHEEGTTRCRGVCFVNFTSPEGAMAAIQAMNGRKVGDKTLHVSIQTRR